MSYAFFFDAVACNGCRACLTACKEKHALPEGVEWRRLFYISSTEQQLSPPPGLDNPFSYWFTLACNHCIHPKCAGVCPTDAYVQRADGIVYINQARCMGCGYCAWACPYAVPQYHPGLGRMTKCDFCREELDQNKPPACVAVCEPAALKYAVVETFSSDETSSVSLDNRYRRLWELPATEHPFPLPTFSRTQPHLAIRPHAAMENEQPKQIISGGRTITGLWSQVLAGCHDVPLVVFTLLVQMSAGMTWWSLLFPVSFSLLLAIGIVLMLGGLVSLLHLGTPRNAWRAVMHLRKSWLSREVLALGVFGVGWTAWVLERWVFSTNFSAWLNALLGVVLVYSMAQVYRLRAAPAWNSWRTGAAFALSAAILGLTGFACQSGLLPFWSLLWGLLALQTGLTLSAQAALRQPAERFRVVCIVTAMVGMSWLPVAPEGVRAWLHLLLFVLVWGEQVLGRWLFYRARVPAL